MTPDQGLFLADQGAQAVAVALFVAFALWIAIAGALAGEPRRRLLARRALPEVLRLEQEAA